MSPKSTKKKKSSTPISDAAKNLPPIPSITSPRWQATYTTHHGTHHMGVDEGEKLLPEDWEAADIPDIRKLVDQHYDKLYPPFEPEIVSTPTKDYYLPALKVLKYREGRYFSPQKESEWEGMELVARCEDSGFPWFQGKVKYVKRPDGHIDMVMEDSEYISRSQHEAPDESCDCGIYGSVNMDELAGYFDPSSAEDFARMALGQWNDYYKPSSRPVMCIVEPSPDAKVIVCRKGWKASKAFISEIVKETISIDDASTLLSIAWRREVDVRRLYANR